MSGESRHPPVNATEIRRQLVFIEDGVSETDKGDLTVLALGGLVPEDEVAASEFLRRSPPYVRDGGSVVFSTKRNVALAISNENARRMGLLGRANAFLRQLAILRVDVTKARKSADLHRFEYDMLMQRCDLFAAKVNEILDDAIDDAEAELYRRAVEGVPEDVYYMGEIVGTKQVYSDGLLQTILKARKPSMYGTHIKMDTKSEVSGTVDLTGVSTETLEKLYSEMADDGSDST